MQREKILVVDDDEMVRRTMQAILEGASYQVTAVAAPDEALNRASQEHFDLVLTDIKMPGMSGVELVHELGRLCPETVCMLVTGYASLDTAQEAIQEGAYDYILKPFDKNGLRVSIAKALVQKKLRDENTRLRELVALYSISQSLASGVGQSQLQESIVRTAVQGTRSACGAILLFDMSVHGVIVGASVGRGEFAVQVANALFQAGIDTSIALMKKGPVLCPCGDSSVEHPLADQVSRWPAGAASGFGPEVGETLLMPVEADGEVIGILSVFKGAQEGHFANGDLSLLTILCAQLGVAERNRRQLSNLESNCLQCLSTVATFVDNMGLQTRGHMERVAWLSRQLGKRMGLSEGELDVVEVGARLHDIGKLGLSQPGYGAEAELLMPHQTGMDNHPEVGDRILAPVPFLAEARRIVYYHHERLDGQGFPLGLTKNEMSPPLYIVQVANFYDNLTSVRPTLPRNEVIAELIRGKNSRFDSETTDRFAELVTEAGTQYHR